MVLRIRSLVCAAGLAVASCTAVGTQPLDAPAHTTPVANSTVQLPAWAEAIPSSADILRAYPLGAMEAGVEGMVRLRCTVLADRHVECVVSDETPSGLGFGPAALKLAPLFVIRSDHPKSAPGSRVAIPVRFALVD